jgi:CheY-like chemotaxis protein
MNIAGGTYFVPFVTTQSPPPSAPQGLPNEDHRRHAAAPHCPVLIVEDDADLREMMAQLLTLEGYGTATASNGREALRLLHEAEVPKVILLDLMMPVMDGWEFRRQQRADPSIAELPVIVLSALDPNRASNLAASAFLKKPLDFDRLLQLVRNYCG